MTIQAVKNQYVGINAHLHSKLQAEGRSWKQSGKGTIWNKARPSQ